MKTLGYILITVGFLTGSYYSILDTREVLWPRVVPALVVGLLGVTSIQIALRGKRRATDTIRSSIEKLEESLNRIAENAEAMDRDKASYDVYEIHHRIDELFMEDLDVFVTHRESIAHAYGLQPYADVMTHFATGERYLNRSWSASTDGYRDEVTVYLERARDQFRQALDLLRLQRSPERAASS